MKKILRELRQNKTCLIGVLILLFFLYLPRKKRRRGKYEA